MEAWGSKEPGIEVPSSMGPSVEVWGGPQGSEGPDTKAPISMACSSRGVGDRGQALGMKEIGTKSRAPPCCCCPQCSSVGDEFKMIFQNSISIHGKL